MQNGVYFRHPIYELVKGLGNQQKTDQKGRFEFLAALLGCEPGFSPGKGGVLTIRRSGQNRHKKTGGIDGARTRDLLRDRQTL